MARIKWLFLALMLSGFHDWAVASDAESPSPSPDTDCDLEESGAFVTMLCPYESLLLEDCYKCFTPLATEVIICHGWTEDEIRAQCESPTRLRSSALPPDDGRCHMKDVTASHHPEVRACPMRPILTPISVNQSLPSTVLVEFLQLHKRGSVSWMAMDCIDPTNPERQEGDPSGSDPTNPTCSDCCLSHRNIPLGRIPGSRRSCMCTQGYATVAVYVHDQQVYGSYGPLAPPVPDHCRLPADSMNTCRFVYRIPCGCMEELYEAGEHPNLNVLKPATLVTMLDDGSKRIQQTLDLEFTPSDPDAGPPIHTHLRSDITVDPRNHSFVDLSDHVKANLVGCFQTYIVIEVEKGHQLEDLLSPTANEPLAVILTAPATWQCNG